MLAVQVHDRGRHRVYRRGTLAPVDQPSRLLGTKKAALELGVDRGTLWRWWTQEVVRPAYVTAGGQARWDVVDVRRQLAAHHAQLREAPMPEPATHPEHQPVAAAIVTSELGVLAGRRNDGKPPWTFIAGEIEPGESSADAAVREVKEETGLRVKAAEVEIGRRVHPKTGRTMVYLACEPVEDTDVFVGDEEELAEVKWLSLAEVDDLMPGVFEPVRTHLERLIS